MSYGSSYTEKISTSEFRANKPLESSKLELDFWNRRNQGNLSAFILQLF